MVYFIDVSDACLTVLGLLFFIRELLKIVCMIVPIGLIVMLMVDFAKGVISFNDDSKKLLSIVLRRIIYTVVIFLIPSTIFGFLGAIGVVYDDSESCWTYAGEVSVEEVKKIAADQEEALKKENQKLQENLNSQLKFKRSAISDNLSTSKIVYSNESTNDNSEAESSDQTGNNKEKLKIRLTSFSNFKLGTGINKNSKNVKKNKKGWYTYKFNGKVYIVVATATKELKKSSPSFANYNPTLIFTYYDTMKIKIGAITYNAIVLDSCGACMRYKNGVKIDLWTDSESQNFSDYQYLVSY